LSEEDVDKVTFTVIKAIHRKVHSSTLKAKLLWLELKRFLNNIVGKIPDLFALRIKT
jgi:hypothetical protein